MNIPRRFTRIVPALASGLVWLGGCDKSSKADPTSPSEAEAVTIRGGINWSAPLPDSGVWHTTRRNAPDSGRGSIWCDLAEDGKYDCPQVFVLRAPLGTDSVIQELYAMGLPIGRVAYTQAKAESLLQGGAIVGATPYYELVKAFRSEFPKGELPTLADFTSFYAAHLLAADTLVLGKDLPNTLAVESVQKALVLMAAKQGLTAQTLSEKDLLGLSSAAIHTIVRSCVQEGTLKDTTALYPLPRARVTQEVNVVQDLRVEGSAVALTGAFAWSAQQPLRDFRAWVVSSQGADTNVRIQYNKPPEVGSGLLELTGNATLRAGRGAVIGTDTLILQADDGMGIVTSRTVFRVMEASPVNGPTLAIASPSADTTVSFATEKLLVVVQASAPRGIAEVVIGAAHLKQAPYFAAIDLVAGLNRIVVKVTDSAGTAKVDSVLVTRQKSATAFDTTPPVIEMVSPRLDTTVGPEVATMDLVWKTTDNEVVQRVTWNDSAVPLDSGLYKVKMALQPGVNTSTIRALDTTGNVATRLVSITRAIDSAKPAILPPPDRTVAFADSSLQLVWKIANPGKVAKITLDGKDVPLDSQVVSNVVLRPGPNTFTLILTDATGASSTSSVVVVRAAETAILGLVGLPDRKVPAETESDSLVWTVLNSSKAVAATLNGQAVSVGPVIAARVKLETGNNLFVLALVDAKGDVVADTVLVVRASDITPPVITWIAPTSNQTVEAVVTSFVVQVKVSDASGIDSVWLNGVLTKKEEGDKYSATVSLPKPDGNPVAVVVVAKDAKGNSARDSLTITRKVPDNTDKPVIKLLKPAAATGNTLVYEAPSIHLEADITDALLAVDPKSVTMGGIAATGTGSVYAADIPVPATGKVFTITIKASNVNGTTSTLDLEVTRAKDGIKPVIAPDANTKTQSVEYGVASIDLSWAVSDNHKVASIALNGQSQTVAATIKKTLALQVGANSAVLVVTDSTGNIDSSVVVVTRKPDAVKPVVTFSKPTKDTTLPYGATSVAVVLTATDAGGSGIDSVKIGTTKWTASPYATTVTGLKTGANVLVAIAYDKAGNVGLDTLIVTVAADLKGPDLQITSHKDGDLVPFGTTSLSVTAKATDAESGLQSITIGKKTCTTSPCTGDYPLGTDGRIVVTALDKNSRSAADTVVVKFDKDRTPPVVTRAQGTKDTTLGNGTYSLKLTWKVVDNGKLASVQIDGKTVTGVAGEYSANLSVGPGTKKVVLLAQDAEGNKTSDAVTIQVLDIAKMPTLSPDGSAVLPGKTLVSLTSATKGATICYTMGKNPSAPAQKTMGDTKCIANGGTVEVTRDTTIRAIAVMNGYTNSLEASAKFTVKYEAKLASVTVDGQTKPVTNTSIDWTVSGMQTSIALSALATDKNAVVKIDDAVATTGKTIALTSDLTKVQIEVSNGTALPVVYTLNIAKADTATVVDADDKQAYRAVKLGNLWWFAQNLNWGADVKPTAVGTCAAASCEGEGRRYTWLEATTGRSSKEVCPDGWRLPTRVEWNALKLNQADRLEVLTNSTVFWSSTADGDTKAWAQQFAGLSGSTASLDRVEAEWIRCVK